MPPRLSFFLEDKTSAPGPGCSKGGEHYPVDNTIGFRTSSPLDSDLSGGWRYPIFEQQGPDVFSSCSFITHANFETSSVMVSGYGYEI